MRKMIVELFMGCGMLVLFLISLACTFIPLFYRKKEKAAITSKIFLFSLCLYMVVGMIMIRIEYAYAVLLMVSPYVWIPWAVSVATGYCGYVYIDCLKEQTERDKRDLIMARERQFIPIFDYISMRKIWKEYKKQKEEILV